MVTTHGGGTSRKRMHACKDYSGAEIMRTLRDEVLNRGIPVIDFTSAIELIKEGGMTGTVLNDHIAQSHAAVDAAVDVLAGGEMQNYYWANYAKVDQAYVEANY